MTRITFILLASLMVFASACESSKKTSADGPALTGTQWRLVELNGKPVEKSADPNRDITMKLDKGTGRIAGYSGCNNFTGSFTSASASRISFSPMAGTRKACMDGMEREAEFLKVFETADNYSLSGSTLSLNKARMAPLARFEAVQAP
jgi:heat shock protein HslJ